MARPQTLAERRGERPLEVFSVLRQPGRWVTLPSSPQIIYLRRFKDLRTLSLSGNPIAEEEDYKMFICAYLPDLVYLDFRRIDDHMASVFLWVSWLCESVFRPSRLHGKGRWGRAPLRSNSFDLPPWAPFQQDPHASRSVPAHGGQVPPCVASRPRPATRHCLVV